MKVEISNNPQSDHHDEDNNDHQAIQMNLPFISNNSRSSRRNPLDGSFHGGFGHPLPQPFPFVRIPYWEGSRPIVNYCPAVEGNQNYYRREIFRSHPHGEHDNNSSIHITQQQASLGREFNRPQPLSYAVSPYSYLPPIHVGVSFIVPEPSRPLSPPHLSFPHRPPPLTILVVNQIDHYFSEKNLETDHHLKSLMDDQGWVHVDHIVKFRRVWNLTHNITLILKSLSVHSKVVEVKDKCMRRRKGWEKWIIKKSDDRVSKNN